MINPVKHTVTEETYKSFTDERNPLKCAKCAKIFPCQAKLQYHIMQYLNVKPYQCEECKKRFSKSYVLTRHIKNAHTGNKEKIFECTKCNRRFISSNELKHHIFVHKAPQFKCKICDRVYKHKKNLTSHMRLDHSEKG